MWDPGQYQHFGDERSRPFFDLLARVAADDPGHVADAMRPARTAGAELAIPGMLWCSATQYRRNPHRSACCARSTLRRSASRGDSPVGTGHRSSTDRGTESRALTSERLPERA